MRNFAILIFSFGFMALSFSGPLEGISLKSQLKIILAQDMPSELMEVVSNENKLVINAKQLNTEVINICKFVPAGFHYAQYSKRLNSITVSKSLIESTQSCPTVLSSILKKKISHELFHAYDLNKDTKFERTKQCKNSRLYHPKLKTKYLCKKVIKNSRRRGFVSDDVRFKNIAQLQGHNQKEFKGVRTLNPYELKSNYEFSATNFEAFIYDKEYKCRRPTLHNYFKNLFNFEPPSSSECHSTNYLIPQDGISQKIKVDPSRIYQVHYLNASAGKQLMSRFGHSMIRFIVCAPERFDKITNKLIPATEFGEKCMADLEYHFVASYRAQVAEASIDGWGGINGKYPSTLYLAPLKSVMKEYNVTELRDLESYPLLLTKKEKEGLIKRTFESFWEYRGSYKFFTNNCATETYNLIIGVRNDLELHLQSSITPNGVLTDLISNGLITENALEEIDPQIEIYYIFKSKKPVLEAVTKLLIENQVEVESYEAYLSQDYAERKLFLESSIDKILSTNTVKKKKIQLLSSLMVLERRAYVLATNLLLGKHNMLFYDLKNNTDDATQEVMLKLNMNSQVILKNSYGIPSREEFKKLEHAYENIDIGFAQEFFAEKFEGKFQIEKTELNESKSNFMYINTVIRKLKKGSL